nr:tail fiber domain-containing protein [Sphingomonas sp. CROZ-RG-20F-R02-07]
MGSSSSPYVVALGLENNAATADDSHGVAIIATNSANTIRNFLVFAASSHRFLVSDQDTLRIDAAALHPTNDNAYNLGGSSQRWANFYLASGAISTSDEAAKTAPLPFEDALLDAWASVQWVQFQYLDAVAEKGAEHARIHWGVIAQQVRDALAAGGIDGHRYGVLCFDQWNAHDLVVQYAIPAVSADDAEDGVAVEGQPEITKTVAAGERWGIRYDLAQAIEAAYQRRRMDRIEARLAAMEARPSPIPSA